MSNSLITPTIIAKEGLRKLKNKMVLGNLVHTDYAKEFTKVGSTINIRKPVKFVASDGATRVNQDVTEGTLPVAINQQKHVSWNFSSADLTLTIENYSDRYIEPAMIALGQKVESSLAGLYNQFSVFAGTPGTPPSNFLNLGAARQKLVEHAAPIGEKLNAALTPGVALTVANDLKTLFTPNKTLTALEEARIGKYAGFDTYECVSLVNHTVGALGGTSLVNGATQNSNSTPQANSMSLVTDGWTASVTGLLKAGDVITIAGVNDVNPVTYQDLGYLKTFVVVSDAASDGSGNSTLTIAPAIVTSGPYQNVTAGPADNAAITVKTGTAATPYGQNMCFHRNAMALVWAPLEMPDGASFKAMETDPDTGMSVRVIKMYDIDNDKDIIRLDILFGVAKLYDDLLVRLTS